ncbi:MAG: epoxyqueuosine reductase [Candidatus Abyssobacteria bacterium SURF_17]|uniref:Epoxyqueuosine reductase n=1 Tax=Candidatus Abyssobacteria bacterium SURF_17 TaxID=2093361 RepID=A0A419ESZ1_9BACT|nr:MAG: epoxyqueuosine reductase [Candidatus Abyssubacteria bacterium SURF_17]
MRQIITSLGADLCGIAHAGRFAGAPEGFKPIDIWDKCKSVAVFARRLPAQSLFAENCVPYTFVNTMMTQEVDRLTMQISLKLEALGIENVPIPSDDPYEHWEAERSYGRAILSLKHAAYLAGLGVLGKNTLLMNEQYGNMIQIGAVLLEADLEGDSLASYEGCPSGCQLCLESCPAAALDGDTVNQHLCRPLSNYRTEKGYILKKCYECRKVCPNALSIMGKR